MITNVLAGLAAVGLLTAGVAATTETRSSSAITPASAVAPKAARAGVARAVAQAAARPDCTLESNAALAECANPAARDAALTGAGGHGVSGAVLGVLGLGGIGAAVAAGAKSDSNG